jgi:hypothetical protein
MLTVQRLYFTASMSTSDEIVKKTLTIVLCFDGTAGEYSGSVTVLSRPSRVLHAPSPQHIFTVEGGLVQRIVSLLLGLQAPVTSDLSTQQVFRR